MSKIFFSILLKLTRLKAAIEAEQKRPQPDWMRLFRLKRLRLKLKDKLLAIAPQPMSAQSPKPVMVQVQGSNKRSPRRFVATSRTAMSQGGRS